MTQNAIQPTAVGACEVNASTVGHTTAVGACEVNASTVGHIVSLFCDTRPVVNADDDAGIGGQ